MIVTILDGNTAGNETVLAARITDLAARLESTDVSVTMVNLAALDIKQCIGCWECWVKTPGLCVIKDSMPGVHRAVLNSDLVIIAAPMLMGFPCALTKRTMDRMIPLLHPYITLIQGECHHPKRYDKYPDWGVLLEPESDTDDEDLAIVRRLYERYTINFHGRLRFLATTATPIEEVLHEACAV